MEKGTDLIERKLSKGVRQGKLSKGVRQVSK